MSTCSYAHNCSWALAYLLKREIDICFVKQCLICSHLEEGEEEQEQEEEKHVPYLWYLRKNNSRLYLICNLLLQMATYQTLFHKTYINLPFGQISKCSWAIVSVWASAHAVWACTHKDLFLDKCPVEGQKVPWRDKSGPGSPVAAKRTQAHANAILIIPIAWVYQDALKSCYEQLLWFTLFQSSLCASPMTLDTSKSCML